MKTVDIVIPVYNEENTIENILNIIDNTDFCGLAKNIIIVDDCSTDSTRELLAKYEDKYTIVYNNKNSGKGFAVSTGFKYLKGDITLIQDADLEYDPKDYSKLIKIILDEEADVVYGSRFINNPMKNFMLSSFLANKFLTCLTNFIYGTKLTDMETCYKAIKTEFAQKLTIKAKKFDLEPEITAKLVKMGAKFKEAPISYCARGYEKGKKINCIDGIMAIFAIIKYKFTD